MTNYNKYHQLIDQGRLGYVTPDDLTAACSQLLEQLIKAENCLVSIGKYCQDDMPPDSDDARNILRRVDTYD